VIAAYSLVCASTQVLWLTYAAITTESARHYGVSVGAIGWLAEIFPLLYVLLAIPAGILLDRWFRPVLTGGGALVAAGGLVRLGGDTFAWAMAGQVAVAVAQPVVLSAVSKLAGEYLPVHERATGIAVGSAGSFVGMLLALLLGPTVGGHGHLEGLLQLEAVLAVIPAVMLALALRRPGAVSDRSSEIGQHAAIAGNAARRLWAQPAMRTMCGLVFIGFGVFVALATWLQALLEPEGVSETAAGLLLVGMVIAGVIGCAAIAPLVMSRGSERSFMRSVVLVSCAGCLALGVVPWLGVRAAVIVVMGLFLLPSLPIILTATERLAGPAAGTAGAIVWMAGNLGGLVVALIVQVLVHHPMGAFVAMAVVSLLGLPLVARLAVPRAYDEPACGEPATATAEVASG
jgi:predicted MFS family arabinose efflux permease